MTDLGRESYSSFVRQKLSIRYVSIAKLLLILIFFLLGMPLEGYIPFPVRSGQIVQHDYGQKLLVAYVWGGVYFIALMLCFRRPLAFMRVMGWNRSYVLLILWFGISVFWSPSILLSLLMWFQLLGTLLVASAIAIYLHGMARTIGQCIWIGATLSVCANFVAILLWPDITIAMDGRWAGMTGNSNFLGALAATGMIAGATAMPSLSNRIIKLFATVSMLFLAGMMMQAASATSVVAAVIAIVWVIHARLSFLFNIPVTSRNIIVFLTVALVGYLLASGGYEIVLGTLGKSEHLTGRTGIWVSAVSLVMQKPLVGHGIGSDTLNLGVLPWATTFHNGYLDIAVKGGFVALALLFIWLVKHLSYYQRNANVHHEYGLLFGGMASLAIVFNLAESAFMLPRSPVSLAFIIVAFALVPSILVWRTKRGLW